MRKKIVWSLDAHDDLIEIIAYIKENAGTKTANPTPTTVRDPTALTPDSPGAGE